MRTDRPDTEFVVRDPQRLPQLGADHPASGPVRPEQAAQVLRADHRLPRPVKLTADHPADLDHHHSGRHHPGRHHH